MQGQEPFAVQADFKIVVYQGQPDKKHRLFWSWLNTAFLNGSTCVLDRSNMDKVLPHCPVLHPATSP